MKTKLDNLIEDWKKAGYSEAVIAICSASPMVASLKEYVDVIVFKREDSSASSEKVVN